MLQTLELEGLLFAVLRHKYFEKCLLRFLVKLVLGEYYFQTPC